MSANHAEVVDRVSDPAPPGRLAYLIPEYPGQTHIWMQREITHMGEWGVPIQVFSTRPPSDRDRARHAFAAEAAARTIYLWPIGPLRAVGLLLWAIATRPLGLLRCVGLGLTLPIDRKPGWARILPLIVPACAWRRTRVGSGASPDPLPYLRQSRDPRHDGQAPLGHPLLDDPQRQPQLVGGRDAGEIPGRGLHHRHHAMAPRPAREGLSELAPGQAILGRIGVDTRKWVPDPEPPPSRPGVRLLSVGRLHASKRHDILIEAVKVLVDGGRDVSLRIVGDGPLAGELKALASSLGLADRVEFLGSLSEDQIIQLMRSADIFALASKAEPLGVVYMEAMAMQVPAIGTAAGGVGEIITDGVDGLLVPPGDAPRVAEAIRRLMDDESLRRQIAVAGRRTVVERFDSRIGARTLYERMFGRSPAIPQP